MEPDARRIFTQQMAQLRSPASSRIGIPSPDVVQRGRQPATDLLTGAYHSVAPSRSARESIAVIGMCSGLAEMVDSITCGTKKRVLPKYNRELRRACVSAFQQTGKFSADHHGGTPSRIAALDNAWSKWRRSVPVYTAMLIPMIGDIETVLKSGKTPQKGRVFAELRKAVEKISRYYEQRVPGEEYQAYGYELYLTWRELCSR